MENNTNERELVVSRLLDAPVELVWDAWTDPGQIAQWWGPNGFRCTISVMDLKPGGDWLLVLHGPEGTDYDNKSIFTELIPFEKFAYEHVSYPHFITKVIFEAQGGKTQMRWHMLFDSEEEYIKVVKTYGVEKGLQENVMKLASYLSNKTS